MATLIAPGRRVMSRGLGRIERAIAAEIAGAARHPNPMSVHIGSHQLTDSVYRPQENSGAGFGKAGTKWDWEPNLVQRKAVARAMHSFVRKHQQYALAGGLGHKSLYLYDTADPVSVMWAKLSVKHRRFVSQSEAKKALNPDD
jgi:hypothetical protein